MWVKYALDDDFSRMFRSFDNLFRGMFGDRSPTDRRLLSSGKESEAPARRDDAVPTWAPAVETFRRGEDLVVRAELPGVSRDQLDVSVDEGRLTIRGEKKDERGSDKDARVYWREVSYGTFERSFLLPEGLDAGDIKASFKNGLLEVTLPLPKPERRKVTIDVDSEKAA
jgi:HSP20 family protein